MEAAAAAAVAKRARTVHGSAPDRLSALSDEVLCHVLSFLPSRQAVQTTVLSKRWTDLWRSVPAISVDHSDFGGGCGVGSSWRMKLQRFTNKLLRLNNAHFLDAFRLDLSFVDAIGDPALRRDAGRWVRRAIKCQPVVLEVNVNGPGFSYHFQIPRLGSEFCRLKRLELHGVILDACFSERLSSGCPVLEDLLLWNCGNNFAAIQSDTLSNLVVGNCSSQVADTLVVRAPCLASMSLESVFYKNGLSLLTGNSLVKASISVSVKRFSPRIEVILLSSVSSVTSLELQFFQAMALLDNEFDKFPMFDNLRTLSLGRLFSERDVDKFKALGRFLHKSPNLEELILKDFWYSESTERMLQKVDTPWLKMVKPVIGPIEIPMLENLRSLVLDRCDLRDNFRILRHLLRSSPNLEKLTVRHCELPFRRRKGNGKKTNPPVRSLVRFQCRKLKSTEIIYKKGAKIQELVRFLLDISRSATKNSITLTKVPRIEEPWEGTC